MSLASLFLLQSLMVFADARCVMTQLRFSLLCCGALQCLCVNSLVIHTQVVPGNVPPTSFLSYAATIFFLLTIYSFEMRDVRSENNHQAKI